VEREGLKLRGESVPLRAGWWRRRLRRDRDIPGPRL